MKSDLPETASTYLKIWDAVLDNFGVEASLPQNSYDSILTFDYCGERFVIGILACRDTDHDGDGFVWSGRWQLMLGNGGGKQIAKSRPLDRNVEVAARRLMEEVRRFLAWKAGHFRPRLVVDNTVSV